MLHSLHPFRFFSFWAPGITTDRLYVRSLPLKSGIMNRGFGANGTGMNSMVTPILRLKSQGSLGRGWLLVIYQLLTGNLLLLKRPRFDILVHNRSAWFIAVTVEVRVHSLLGSQLGFKRRSFFDITAKKTGVPVATGISDRGLASSPVGQTRTTFFLYPEPFQE